MASDWKKCKCPTCGGDAETTVDGGRRVFRTQRKRRTRFEPAPIPKVLDTPEFKKKWGEWLRWRRARNWSVRPDWQKKQLAMLAEHGPEASIAALDESMMQGWMSVNPKKKAGAKPKPRDAKSEWAEDLERELGEQ